MGWTSYHATHYKRNGSIDRKAELDYELFCHEGEDGHKLVKSSMVGAVYYAAVHHPKGHVCSLSLNCCPLRIIRERWNGGRTARKQRKRKSPLPPYPISLSERRFNSDGVTV